MTNPFFEPSTLPYSMPPFAEIEDGHYWPAFEKGMAEQLEEIQNITRRRDMPTFENTMVPARAERCAAHPRRQRVLQQGVGGLQRFDRRARGGARAAARRRTSTRSASTRSCTGASRPSTTRSTRCLPGLDLDAEQRYLVERYYMEATIAGAGLDDEQKEQLKEFNSTLSTLCTKFEKNLLADTNDLAVVIDDAAELDGLDAGEISAAAEAAKERGLDGKYLVTLVLPTGHPWLVVAHESQRARAHHDRIAGARRTAATSGTTSSSSSRSPVCAPSAHACWASSPTPRGSPPTRPRRTRENVAAMLNRLAAPAARNAKRRAGRPAGAGDRRYRRSRRTTGRSTREKVRQAKYEVDETRDAPVLRGRARAAGRRLLRGDAAVRRDVHRASRHPRLPPRRARVRGARTRTAPLSACTRSTSTPATRSAAARG